MLDIFIRYAYLCAKIRRKTIDSEIMQPRLSSEENF